MFKPAALGSVPTEGEKPFFEERTDAPPYGGTRVLKTFREGIVSRKVCTGLFATNRKRLFSFSRDDQDVSCSCDRIPIVFVKRSDIKSCVVQFAFQDLFIQSAV